MRLAMHAGSQFTGCGWNAVATLDSPRWRWFCRHRTLHLHGWTGSLLFSFGCSIVCRGSCCPAVGWHELHIIAKPVGSTIYCACECDVCTSVWHIICKTGSQVEILCPAMLSCFLCRCKTTDLKFCTICCNGCHRCCTCIYFLGRLPKVDLIILEGENVRPYVRPSVRPQSCTMARPIPKPLVEMFSVDDKSPSYDELVDRTRSLLHSLTMSSEQVCNRLWCIQSCLERMQNNFCNCWHSCIWPDICHSIIPQPMMEANCLCQHVFGITLWV